jgi:predicted glycosyltransferase
MKRMKVWIDIKNSHEPLFFKSIISKLEDYDFVFTARDYIEVTQLLKKFNYSFIPVGKHHGKNLALKLYGLCMRELGLYFRTGEFDVALSHGSPYSVHVAVLKRKKSIHIYDNDLPTLSSRIALPFLDYLILPKCIDAIKFKRFSKKVKIFPFDGFKENIYVADYKPDPDFLDSIPFKDFVTVRPEALKAEYVPKKTKSIVPEILAHLGNSRFNVLYLPRYEEDRIWVDSFKNVFIPPEPLNGLDVCYYSQAVLTGSGTLAREAAVLGIPAVSFFPGKELLSVDREMIKKGWLMHSRDALEIIGYIEKTKKRESEIQASQEVRKEVINILIEILENIQR